jgi:hypothetical protein
VRKNSTIVSSEGRFVGLDISDRQGTYAVLADDGRIVDEGKVLMTKVGLSRCFAESGQRLASQPGAVAA